jgi:hypothetical protein
MPWLVNNTPIMKPSRSHLLKELTMHNLALPAQMFYGQELGWGHQCPAHLLPYHVSTKAEDQYVPILWLLRNLKVVGAVEWDFDALDKSIVDWLLGWAKNVGNGAVKKIIQKQLEASLSCVQLGWVKAMKEGRKRPALKIITVNGD